MRGLAMALLASFGSGVAGAQQKAAPGSFVTGSLIIDTLERTYSVYVPATAGPESGILVVLHGGSGGSGARIRRFIGAELEALADSHGFVIAYPNGVGGSWNDCRADATYPAKLAGVDDVRFVRDLISRIAGDHGVRSDRYQALGFSNGAHLALRIAFESPDALGGIVTFAANMPDTARRDCRVSRLTVPVLLVTGTADPINPFEGGEVVLPDGVRLGRVRSAHESLHELGMLAGHQGEPSIIARESLVPGGAKVQVRGWTSPTRADVLLLTIEGGGHVVPSPSATYPAMVGPMVREFSGASAAIEFLGLRRTNKP